MKQNIISFRSLKTGRSESILFAVLTGLSLLSVGASFVQGGSMLQEINQVASAEMATNVIGQPLAPRVGAPHDFPSAAVRD